DFCRRIDLRAVNRRVIESLIKCGAFDSTGILRPRLMAALDEAIKGGQAHQRDFQSNQIDIFEVLGGTDGKTPSGSEQYPEVEPWSTSQVLAFEKETLGFYITGHPLDNYEAIIKKLPTCNTVRQCEKSLNGQTKIAGVVTALRLRNTKKGDRYASFNLEDKSGYIAVIVWPDVYLRSSKSIILDDAILVEGRLDVGEERVQLIANEVFPLAEVNARIAQSPAEEERSNEEPPREPSQQEIHFHVQASSISTQELTQLHDMLLQYRGTCPVLLHLIKPDRSETIIALPHRFDVDPSPKLIDSVSRTFGDRITPNPTVF
ncbi:MAG: OB-fold nucleic acid binding domain-containing protein, partial [Candidatus Binatia bacterium]|nr:OB-fold nucleic acid binding domain-containing protein [Candidatus Binatia bacterium]